jgi:hypothetical protein
MLSRRNRIVVILELGACLTSLEGMGFGSLNRAMYDCPRHRSRRLGKFLQVFAALLKITQPDPNARLVTGIELCRYP